MLSFSVDIQCNSGQFLTKLLYDSEDMECSPQVIDHFNGFQTLESFNIVSFKYKKKKFPCASQ